MRAACARVECVERRLHVECARLELRARASQVVFKEMAYDGWVGLTPRDAYETLNVTQTPLLPAWLVLLLASLLIVGGWVREGR